MAPPAFLLRTARLLFLSAGVLLTTHAATFPLPAPARPTTFPLLRPTQAGEVIAWGDNTSGETDVPPGLTNVVAVAAGYRYSVALRSDGSVIAWGNDNRSNVPSGLSGVVSVAVGSGHCAALKENGTVVCWGDNWAGQTTVPSGLSTVVAVAAGSAHTIALKADGTIVGWGNQDAGIPPRVNYDSGYKQATNVIAIAADGNGSFALLSDERTINWGPFGAGIENGVRVPNVAENRVVDGASIGYLWVLRRDGILNPSDRIPLNIRPVKVATGGGFTLAIKGDGSVTVWQEYPGAVFPVVASMPLRLRGVIAIAAGTDHAIAVKLPTPPIPTIAKSSAQIVNGFIVGLNVIDGGEGYDVAPQVTITGGGGSGATATAQISKGIVTGFTMISAGSGYTSQPTITIDSPPLLPKLAIAPSRVNVTMQVVPGKRYQLESSADLPNFSPVGAPFTAASNSITNEFTLSETGQFFRIQEVP